jgi:DNA-binding protein HU-beta
VNTSELVAKITEAHNVRKTQAHGIVDSMLKSLASARAATRTAAQDDGSEVAAPQPVRGEKIKIAASRKLTYSPAKAVKELLND